MLVDDLLIFNCDGAAIRIVAALDAKTGEVQWKTPRNTPARKTFSFCTPLADRRERGGAGHQSRQRVRRRI